LIFSTGLATWLKPWSDKPTSSEKPSIAVLAFSNLSTDPDQDYFAEGIAEDIITDLSKISGLFVIARNSSFSYKGKNVPIKSVADELGVRYVLEGSVRRAGDTLRITAQLIDATTDGHLWAERYDGSISDVFALQDAVTMQIIKELSVRLKPEEAAALVLDETNSPQAYEAFLLGMRHLNLVDRLRQEESTEARTQFERAIEFDKNYGRAYAGLAWTYWYDFIWFNRDKTDKDRALALTDRSINLKDTALARSLRARSYLSFRTFGNRMSIAGTGEHDLAVNEMRKAAT
jgi:adenylate cyclase